MKRIIQIFIFQLFLFMTLNSFSQAIDSMVVTPASIVGINDTVKVYVYNSFSFGSCSGSANYSVNGFNVNASALHCQGALTVICHDVDTIILDPPHSVGSYAVSFVLSSGFGFPSCTPGIVPDDFDTVYYSVSSNAPPTISSMDDTSVCTNSIYGPLPFIINDEDLNTITLTATSDNQVAVSNSNISLMGNGPNRMIQIVSNQNPGIANIKVVIEDNAGQMDSTSFALSVDLCMGISDLVDSDIQISPNPSTGDVWINLKKLCSKLDLELFNLMGQKLKSWTFVDVENIQLQIDQQPGLYVLKLSGPELSSTQYIQLK